MRWEQLGADRVRCQYAGMTTFDDGVQSPSVPPLAAPDQHVLGSPGGAPLAIADEITPLLSETSGQLGGVAKCLAQGIVDRKDIVDAGAAANTGAVSNILSNIRAIRDGEIPTAPTMARSAKSAASSFLKQHRDHLSGPAIMHIEQVIAASGAVAGDASAQDVEEEKLQKKGDELDDLLAKEGGVYVYTYPHYWWYPTVEGTDRTLLKVGMTTKNAGVRVKTQAKHTAVPEDPLLLRVYRSADLDPAALEKRFHRLIRAADHVREGSTSSAGKEWFETSIGFLDTIAEEFELQVLVADDPE